VLKDPSSLASVDIGEKRAIAAPMGWLRYLETTDAPRAYWEGE
jgi:hypothetical protein